MVRLLVSSVIAAPVRQVWEVVRDFDGLPAWSPAVATSQIEGGHAPDRVGIVRSLRMADGSKIREQLLALSDAEMYVTYAIVETELPIENYRSTIRLRPVTDGEQTFITWEGEFDVLDDQHEEMKRQMRDEIYQAGFHTLKQQFARKD